MSTDRQTPPEETIGGLVHQLSEQVPQLIRSEVRLAQLEMTEKGKRAGIGIGMFTVAGLVAFFGVASLVAAAITGLAVALPAWASALIVAAVLLVVAGVFALVGKKRVQAAVPPAPEHAIANTKLDLQAIKGGRA